MNCMKCGRETGEDQAFCQECLADMENYPVRPGTVILLPTQEPPQPKKTQKKKKAVLPPEELVPVMKKKLWTLRVISTLLILLLGAMSFVTVRAVTELDWQRLLGQNYSAIGEETTKPPLGR